MEIEVFVFLMEAFLFSKFYENEAKHDKRNFKRGLSMTFVVKNDLHDHFFLRVNDQIIS